MTPARSTNPDTETGTTSPRSRFALYRLGDYALAAFIFFTVVRVTAVTAARGQGERLEALNHASTATF
jgi:hypothetical protein